MMTPGDRVQYVGPDRAQVKTGEQGRVHTVRTSGIGARGKVEVMFDGHGTDRLIISPDELESA